MNQENQEDPQADMTVSAQRPSAHEAREGRIGTTSTRSPT
jgi:hypothetical protein